MSLTITVKERQPGVFILYPEGPIDTNTHAILEGEVERIVKVSPRILIIDMEKVDYMSSMGVRAIIKAKKALKEIDGAFIMAKLQPQIKKVFAIINALPDQQIFNSVEELDEYLAKMQKQEIEERESSE